MHQAFQIAPGPIYPRKKPIRSARYLRFVKGFACAACNGTCCIDPAHTGSHGLRQKSDDASVIPLCRKCHREFDANPREFAIQRGLDIPALIAYFNYAWELKQRRTA